MAELRWLCSDGSEANVSPQSSTSYSNCITFTLLLICFFSHFIQLFFLFAEHAIAQNEIFRPLWALWMQYKQTMKPYNTQNETNLNTHERTSDGIKRTFDMSRLAFWNRNPERCGKIFQNYLPMSLLNNLIGTVLGKISLQYGIVCS